MNGSKGSEAHLFGVVSNLYLTMYTYEPTEILVCGRKLLLPTFDMVSNRQFSLLQVESAVTVYY